MKAQRCALVAVVALAVAMIAGGFWRWPWDHDEVLAFAELGLIPVEEFAGPPEQLRRIRSILPVWYGAQRQALSLVPHDEFGARLLPVMAGVAAVFLMAWWARHRASTWFASGLVLLAGCSPMLIWLSQQNRFYSLAMLLMIAALAAASSRRAGWLPDLSAVAFGIAAILTHNLTLVVFAIAAAAAVAAHGLRMAPWLLLRRTAILAAVSLLIYVTYLRPALAGWVSGGTGGTLPLVSFVAQFGTVPLGLVLTGGIALARSDIEPDGRWWLLLAAGSVAFVAVVPLVLKAWNPRYALFFMWPCWVVAAIGACQITERLERPALRLAWLAALLVMMSPKLASHLADGTRHDFRSAAGIVARLRPGVVVSNWPATLGYYLKQQHQAVQVRDWQFGTALPAEAVIAVIGSNAWEPVFQPAGRSVTVVDEVRTRRFDEQSHVIRIYRVGEAGSGHEDRR